MTTTTNTETTTMTTASKAKVTDRYHALVTHAHTLPEFTFEKSKKPTSKDCDELSEAIAKYEAGLADVIEMAKAAPVVEAVPTLPVDDVDSLADTVDSGTPVAATVPPTERDEARAKFFNATKATKAHGYRLLAAATGDGSRRDSLRAALAELPEGIRAGACKIAMSLVVAGGSMQDDLKAVHDEQPTPVATSAAGGKGGAKRDRNEFVHGSARAIRSSHGSICVRGKAFLDRVGKWFSVTHDIVDGKLVVTLVEK